MAKLLDVTKLSKSCKIGNNTRLEVSEGIKRVTLHYTTIATITDNSITLNAGGWHTVTTKQRINIVLAQYGIDKRIVQRKKVWYINGELFYNGYVITLNEEN